MDEMNSRRWGGTSSPCFFSFDLFVFFPIAIALNLYLALYLFYSHFLHPAPCHEIAYFCLTVSTKFENNMTWRLLTLMFPRVSQAIFASAVSLREWLWAACQRVVCLVQFYFLISSEVATGTSWCLWTDWRLDVPQLVLGLSCNLPENFVPAWHQVGRQLWYQLGRHPMDVKPQFELNQQPAITGGQVLCTTSGNALTVTLIAGNERHSFCLRAVTGSVKISNIALQPPPPPLSGTSPWVVDFGLLQCRLHFFSWS